MAYGGVAMMNKGDKRTLRLEMLWAIKMQVLVAALLTFPQQTE